jgi:hypothetical protein
VRAGDGVDLLLELVAVVADYVLDLPDGAVDVAERMLVKVGFRYLGGSD